MRKCFLRSIAVVAVGTISLAAFYVHFEYKAHAIVGQHQLAPRYVNGIKHAYTAAYTYQALRALGVPSQSAQHMTLYLGMGNEYFERVIKYYQPDSMKEIMKDMHNNHAGVAAVRWHEKHRQPTRPHYASIEAMVGRMAEERAILPTEQDLHEQPVYSIPSAYQWAQQQQGHIARKVHHALMLPKRSLAHQEKIALKPSS